MLVSALAKTASGLSGAVVVEVFRYVARQKLQATACAVALALFVVGVYASALSAGAPILRAGGESVRLTVSDTPALRERGLSGSLPLANNQGMLLVFEQSGDYCFWMKGMLYSIDIVWLDDQYRVVHVEHDVSPSSYPDQFCPGTSAKYVVELAADRASELGLKNGSQVKVLR